MKNTLLLVEDDIALREATAAFLEGEGFSVMTAADGEKGLSLALEGKADLLILDVMLPGLDGFDLCRRLRAAGRQTPVIILTGKKREEADKVLGLEIGADDYVVKPFGQRELLARVQAVLRRAGMTARSVEEFVFGDVRIDFKKKTALRAGKPLDLTVKEFGLLKLFAEHEGEAVSRETILNEVWGYKKYPTTRTVDTFIHGLRRKVEKDPSRPVHLLTVPWMGYRFRK
jgi:DNA-binding response OmpR family regulator